MTYQTSQHAQIRMQQRGIPEQIVKTIVAYGDTHKVPGGARARFISKKSLKALSNTLPKNDCLELERHKNVYVVLNDGAIITVGHRHKRFLN